MCLCDGTCPYFASDGRRCEGERSSAIAVGSVAANLVRLMATASATCCFTADPKASIFCSNRDAQSVAAAICGPNSEFSARFYDGSTTRDRPIGSAGSRFNSTGRSSFASARGCVTRHWGNVANAVRQHLEQCHRQQGQCRHALNAPS